MENQNNKELLTILNNVKNELKSNDIILNMFAKYGVNIDVIDLIPIKFGDIDTSATTDHGIITINTKFADQAEEIEHYLVHEITHYLQQTAGDTATQGSDDGDYLDNEYEIEGFQNQTEYISEKVSDEAAEDYIEKVLDKHNVDESDKDNRKKDLLRLAKELNVL